MKNDLYIVDAMNYMNDILEQLVELNNNRTSQAIGFFAGSNETQ
jgi:tRNA uridine 5-carbamoylmethylation protein Kti12